MDKLKLQWKIFGFLFGFCALLILILWMFQTVFLSDTYKFIRKIEIDKAITLVEKNINSSNLSDILYDLEVSNEIMVRPTQSFVPPTANTNISNKRFHKPETITKEKEFTLEDGRTVSLTFHAMISPVEATVSTIRLQLFIITGIMVLLAILLAIIISKHISKPIEQINKSAKVLAMGNYETQFNGRGFLEIKELSNTLNTAAVELSKVEKLRRELMANVSHDLRTPLAYIYSYAEMMHDFPKEVTSDQSQIIMDEAKRLTSLVNDMLDISNLDKGIAKLNLVNYNLTESLRRTINRVSELVRNDGYTLDLESAKDVFVLADEVKITQAIYNLLFNAINYSGDDKTVIVRQSVNDNVVKIEVIDHGEGINSNDLPYIWDRYYKVDKNHKRPKVGTGLGLSIVKKIIDLHKGKYGVESKVGQGSDFWFEIETNKT